MLKQKQAHKAPANRGKLAEKKVHDYLTALGNTRAFFDWSRIYDARSARGKFPSRPGDFEFYRAFPGQGGRSIHGLIEAKEVHHDFRSPEKNFNTGQIARLYKRQLAGGTIVILVLHTTTVLWRVVPLEYFRTRLSQPSWDLTEFQTYTSVGEAVSKIHALI